MKLWYRSEAAEWTQALPIANGHMGAMCYGGAGGRYDLSENTCWSGYDQPDPLKAQAKEPSSVYKRQLELETGLALDRLKYGENQICRESFISNPDKVMGVRMTAEKEMPPLCLWLEGWSQPSNTRWTKKERLLWVNGRALENIHSDGVTGTAHLIALCYETDGCIVWKRRGLVIQGASRLTLWLTTATDMFDKNYEETCRQRIFHAVEIGWKHIYDRHVTEHREGMERCSFTMPDTNGHLPTDLRIRAFAEKNGGDDGLIALFFFCFSRNQTISKGCGKSAVWP